MFGSNIFSSETCNIFSTLGNTMCALDKFTVVLPNECGSSLKLSACMEHEEEFGRMPVPWSNNW